MGRTNSTWSPNAAVDDERPTMQELENLYASMGQKPGAPGAGAAPVSRYSISQAYVPGTGPVRKFSLGTRMASANRDSWVPNGTQQNGLSTIIESNPNLAPTGRHLSPPGRLMTAPMFQPSQQRFVVTPVQQNLQGPRTRRRSTITAEQNKASAKLKNID